MMNALNALHIAASAARGLKKTALFFTHPITASARSTGYTARAIMGNEIPNTCESGCASTLVQETFELMSQNESNPPQREISYAW